MKRVVYYIVSIGLVLLMFSCKTEEFVKPVLDLELLSNEVYLNLAADISTATVNVRHGNGGYTVESSDETVATAINPGTGVAIEITAKGEGTAVITVTDALGKTALIDVTVSVVLPTSPIFNWAGQAIKFDRPDGYGISILNNKIALTDLMKDQKQYVLSWQGGYSEGDKTGGMLTIASPGSEPELITFTTFSILKANEEGCYLIFRNESNVGEIFFTKE